ncbi:MAG: DUF2066 domain-containing protein [Gammaproteobacteria bacterium]|uniref:DUF2066 domain-containing protein n=1 Tax=Pseudomaricurvus alcaniphilus TaxID=1166482 RepID=UPI00140E1737|nr:DUF2066 domain-containing protein [Pseudomaricurvus alcaniphilus]MBR9908889.1 DUF2066 domain-containing protein [Gammaproteobacteria bacterium]NHN37942.1 DUF2066 domain-containing protein [Pseudomaricurvus alcaniphilus]
MNTLPKLASLLLLWWLPLASLWSPGASAELVANLYQQEELVLDQGSRERRRAVEQALNQVLVRVTGNSRAPNLLALRNAIADPAQLVDAYRYESSAETLLRDGEQLPASRLIISFSRSGIERLLSAAGLPLWSANRPSVLVWLVRDDFDRGRQLVSLQDSSEVAATVQNIARERGLPLVTPLLDLEDRLMINAEKIWQLDSEAIREASSRYQADAIVVGRYSQTSSGLWLAAWSLIHRDRQDVFDLENQQETALVAEGLAIVAEQLAAMYAIVLSNGGGAEVTLELHEVNSFPAYVAAINYVAGLDVVRQLRLLGVEDNRLQLRLQMQGDVDSLTNALQLDRKLIPLDAITRGPGQGVTLPPYNGGGSAPQPLRFRWPG